jgi:hypothetical protein
LASSSVADVWTAIAADAALESPLWEQTLRPEYDRDLEPVFSPLAEERFALAVETIYEGYLAHYGRPRLFAPPDADVGLLLGDYLYAHGLVRISALGDVTAVARLAGLISLCAQLRADGRDGDGEAWAATAALLADGAALDDALASLRDGADASAAAALARASRGDAAVRSALAAHSRRVR